MGGAPNGALPTHGFVKRENQIDAIRRTITWFDQSHGKARKPKTKPNKISPMLWLTLKPPDTATLLFSLVMTGAIWLISKVKRGTAFAAVCGWSAVVVLARVALAAATS
jgi:hypothetical protein